VYEISKDWGEPEEKIDFSADYLHEKGWVKRDLMGGGTRITAAGVDEYERTHG